MTLSTLDRPTIVLEDVSKSYAGRTVVEIPELTLGEHPIEGLIGPNGAGKTTLMGLITHSIALDRGRIELHDPAAEDGQRRRVLSTMKTHEIARLGVVKSNQVIQDFDSLTIWDSLLLAVATHENEQPHRVFDEWRVYDKHAADIERYLELFPFQDPKGFAKSAGEKKLLDILRCLLLKPRVLLLDEPTAGLPDDVTRQVIGLLKELAVSERLPVVIVEHYLNVIWDLSDSVHFMAEGSVLLQGDPSWIRSHDTVVEKYLGAGHVGG